VLGESDQFDARTYAWDATHNKTHRSDVRTGGPLTQTAYQYDGLSRMVSSLRTPGTGNAVTREYALDDVGNRQTVTETIGSDPGTDQDYLLQGVDALVNEYTVTPFEASRDYDANGNLTVLGVDATTQNAIAYDYRNLMVQRTQVVTEQPPSGPSVEEVLSQYEYDALGRRISKTVGTVATRYVYDGWRVIEEFSESGVLQGSYVYGNYLDEVLTLKRGSEEFYFHTDDLWNTVALTDEDGEVIERYDYGDYGQPEFYAPNGTPRAGSIVANPCLFTGQRYDAESGLYWCKTRYLEPTTGRYTTRDTLGIWGDPTNLGNGYTYAANNPWSMLDPFGMCSGEKSMYDRFWDWVEEKFGISHDTVMLVVDGVSFIPVLGAPADAASALDAYLRGDYFDFAASMVGFVPVIGDLGKGAMKLGEFALQHGDEAADAWRWANRGGDALGAVPTHAPLGLCFAAGTLVLMASGMVPIEALEVGDRVLTTDGTQTNPSQIDEAAWRRIDLEMQDSSGAGTVKIDLLRPAAWLESLDADEGETIRISLPEMGLEGPAVVEDIEPCPDIEDGPGRIVLATTACSSACVVQLVFEGQDEPLEATARHRFYSEDRKSWVQAVRLRAGEQLRTQSGLVTLKEVRPVPGTYRVHNLEVETDHCYFVTDDAVLVHNADPCSVPSGFRPRNADLAGKKHPVTDVPFDADGYPVFSGKKVKIELTGNRGADFKAANEAAGLDKTPDDYTWHHHQDETTMQLVPADLHQRTGHTGGFSIRNGKR
jgi:RHS repeat-associated protein